MCHLNTAGESQRLLMTDMTYVCGFGVRKRQPWSAILRKVCEWTCLRSSSPVTLRLTFMLARLLVERQERLF